MEEWHCLQHEGSFFILHWEQSFSHFFFLSHFKEMHDLFISLVEGVFYIPLWSSLSQEINVAHCFHVGNSQWQIKRCDMTILSYREDIHCILLIPIGHALPWRAKLFHQKNKQTKMYKSDCLGSYKEKLHSIWVGVNIYHLYILFT